MWKKILATNIWRWMRYLLDVYVFTAVPRIKNSDMTSKNLVEGDPLVLECKAWGYPDVIVNWTREGVALNASERYRDWL